MNKIVTAAEMKAIDNYTIEQLGVPSVVLMERAALSLVNRLKAGITKKDRILCLCGAGNNGGDGVAVARILFTQGYSASYYMAGKPENGPKKQKNRFR